MIYIPPSFPQNAEAEMLNWRICPDVYVKRFVICKLSIATCSSGGVNGSVSAVLRGSECPSSLLPTRNTQLNEKRDLAHTLSNLEPL